MADFLVDERSEAGQPGPFPTDEREREGDVPAISGDSVLWHPQRRLTVKKPMDDMTNAGVPVNMHAVRRVACSGRRSLSQ
ncbi:hypothetical protein PF66_06294 [Pseudomonas asplenii]|uniref:Uncharacterized protein n=1 Tax=Pseudomonas asplenii TaxID=53407 RepID=A0A0M9GC08_9PSED|nr:hypothetical protein PF66_06294 [Pseudomonas fuscovaginae]